MDVVPLDLQPSKFVGGVNAVYGVGADLPQGCSAMLLGWAVGEPPPQLETQYLRGATVVQGASGGGAGWASLAQDRDS